MKLLYHSGVFSIEGIPVINPKLFISEMGLQYGFGRPLENGDSWDLPDNIIAEKVTQVLNIHNEWVESIYEFDVVGPSIKEVYRLKLKEPLVDTGSKLTYDKINEVKYALGEPGIGALRIVENQFLPDDMVIVSSKMYKALKANP